VSAGSTPGPAGVVDGDDPLCAWTSNAALPSLQVVSDEQVRPAPQKRPAALQHSSPASMHPIPQGNSYAAHLALTDASRDDAHAPGAIAQTPAPQQYGAITVQHVPSSHAVSPAPHSAARAERDVTASSAKAT